MTVPTAPIAAKVIEASTTRSTPKAANRGPIETMTNYEIFRLLGLALLLLGGVSAIALFLRAIAGEQKSSPDSATATLWGLFIVGVLAGIIILASTG